MIQWNIRIQGYGTFQFEGTEAEAEDVRRNKARWEGGASMKWRADLSRKSDRLNAEIAGLFDRGKGVPYTLFSQLKRAMAAEARAVLTPAPTGQEGA